jgi:hypothetical protein
MISSSGSLQVLKDELREVEMIKTEGKQFIGDAHYWLVHDDWMEFLILNSVARTMPGSGTVVVSNPEDIHPKCTVIETLSDGSAVINGEAGECDAVAWVFAGEIRAFAATHMLGLKFCSGWSWKYRKREDGSVAGHNAIWYINQDHKVKLVEPKRPIETMIFDPDPEMGWFHLMVM